MLLAEPPSPHPTPLTPIPTSIVLLGAATAFVHIASTRAMIQLRPALYPCQRLLVPTF